MNRHYFQIAGVTICFEADLDLDSTTFKPAMLLFAVDHPGDDVITLQRYFEIPDLSKYDLGIEIYRNYPWVISENKETGHRYYQLWLLKGSEHRLSYFADFSNDFSFGKVYTLPIIRRQIKNFGLQALSGFGSETTWLAEFLLMRSAVMMHSAGAMLNGKGLMFIGRSETGKTTITRMFQQARDERNAQVTVLCDETNIARRWNNGWQLHGTWGHGEETEVSGLSAPLAGIFVLKKGEVNRIVPLCDPRQILVCLLSTMFRPLMTESWWKKALSTIERLVKEIPVYEMHFNKSGGIISMLKAFTTNGLTD
jgi:hypothetical protein